MSAELFIPRHPTVEDCWRGVVLYGRNTASYKFALASALLSLRPQSGELVKLEDLAPHFALLIAEHLASAPRQITTTNGKFIQACLIYNQTRELDPLVAATVAHGFANVIDAFHIVGSSAVHHLFFIDERMHRRGIRITDEFSQMLAGSQTLNLNHEVDARWRLVETAWNLGVAPNLLAVHHDASLNELFALDASQRRKAVTSSRSALNGYQKGLCFYCEAELQLAGTGMNVDVDHFFPHRLKGNHPELNLDGVWNLVLACAVCNRGPEGKFDRIPAVHLLQRLHQRNEFLIGSHHPLRETLFLQTGATETARVAFLKSLYDQVQLSPNLAWSPRI